MERKDKVSVVMSLYNREKYVWLAIKSVIAQTYDNWELLVVDDCSTDTSSKVVSEIAKDEPRIKYIKNEKNMGAGFSRYTGIKNATGDYIMFLDSDDTYHKGMIATLLGLSKLYDADFVNCGYHRVSMNSGGTSYNVIDTAAPTDAVLTGRDVFYIDNKQTGRFLNVSLTKKKCWDDVEYCKRRFIEDIPPLNKILTKVNKRVLSSYIGYNYLDSEDSLMNNANSEKFTLFLILSSLDTLIWESSRNTDYFTRLNYDYEAVEKELMNLSDDTKSKYPEEIEEAKQLINEYKEIQKNKKGEV